MLALSGRSVAPRLLTYLLPGRKVNQEACYLRHRRLKVYVCIRLSDAAGNSCMDLFDLQLAEEETRQTAAETKLGQN